MTRIRKIRRRIGEHTVLRMAPATHSQLSIMRNFGGASRVVIVGSQVFNIKLAKLLEHESGLVVVGTASTPKDALAIPNEFNADLSIVEVDFGGASQGILMARAIAERSAGCAIMLVCGAFTDLLARHNWVYGTEWWSIITSATAKNPAHVA